MNALEEAIEKLKHLSPDGQKRVIEAIESETRKKYGKPFSWIGDVVENATDLDREDLSENPSLFADRIKE